MYKKILLGVFFFLLGTNQIFASSDVVDFLSGSTKVTYNINFTSCTTDACFQTGTIAISPPVYLKDIICKSGNTNPNFIYGTGGLLQMVISPNSSLTGNYHNILFSQSVGPRTDQFNLDYVYNGTGLYWKVQNFFNTGTGVTAYPPMLCYLNGVKYDPTLIPTYSSSSSGSLSTQNLENILNFQNDYFILFFGVLLVVLFSWLFFRFYCFLNSHYFFKKNRSGKK